MSEKIKTTSEEFQRAVARGDREQIEKWDAEGLIEWNPRNLVGRQLSEEAQRKRQAKEQLESLQASQSDFYSEKQKPEVQGRQRSGRLDRMGVAKDERLWSGHRLTQQALARGDSQLLAEIYSDSRYDRLEPSGAGLGYSYADIQAHMEKDSS